MVKIAEPVKIKCKNNHTFLAVPPYLIAWEADDLILPLEEQGVLTPAKTSHNIHISPVKKKGKLDEKGSKIWKFVQDLWKISVFIIPNYPVVPNPETIPTSVSAEATHFAIIDLYSAFFSIPIYLNTQFLFAFNFPGQQYIWTRLW